MGEVYTLKEIFNKRSALMEGNTTFTILDDTAGYPSRSITLGKLEDILVVHDGTLIDATFTDGKFTDDHKSSINYDVRIPIDGDTVIVKRYIRVEEQLDEDEFPDIYHHYDRDSHDNIIKTKWPNHFIAKGHRLTGGAGNSKKKRCKKGTRRNKKTKRCRKTAKK